MTKTELLKYIYEISPADISAINAARKRQESLAKPPGSLGRLEELSVRMAGITGKVKNYPKKGCILVFAADNGITEEGVSCAPASVTLAQSINMTLGKTGVSTLAAHYGDELRVTDVGIAADYNCPAIRNRKIRYGSANFAKEPAMSEEECIKAICVGIESVEDALSDGFELFGTGEMGIGNTSSAACVLSRLSDAPIEKTAGHGGGLSEEAFAHKKEVLKKALMLHEPFGKDPLEIISLVGGMDIAAMTGVFLGCAKNKKPVFADGFISAVAALCAARIAPAAMEYIFLSHASVEEGFGIVSRELGLKPLLHLDMRLGEGSGCPITFSLLRAACAAMNNMATFEEAGIDDGYLEPLRK